MFFGTLLGTLPESLKKGSTEKLYGANVAMMNFFRALLSYGSFVGKKDMKNMLLFPIIQDTLEGAKEKKLVGEVEEKLLKKYQKYSPTPSDVRYQIAWMLKHGLLELISTKQKKRRHNAYLKSFFELFDDKFCFF